MKKKTILQKFLKGLLLIAVAALAVSTVFVFVSNSRINTKNYEDIILSTIDDIEKDIMDTSDINMIDQTVRIRGKVETVLAAMPLDDVMAINDALRNIVSEESLSEMSIANTENTIIYSSQDEYIGFDMNANADTKAFDALNHGAEKIVQPVRANAYSGEGSYELLNKYAGLPLRDGGYLQIAISSSQFQTQIDEKVSYIAANRHIGQTGFAIIANAEDIVVSNAGGNTKCVNGR